MNEEISYPLEASTAFYEIEDRSYWFRQRNKIIEYFVTLDKKDGNFVDVGGGNGFVSAGLAKAMPTLDIVLVEPSKSGCENAHKRGLKKVFNKTLRDLSEYPLIDNIGAFDVIEHISDDEGFLKELYERLSPGGQVFLTTPAYNSLWSSEDVNAGHFRRYRLGDLCQKATKQGFKVQESTYFFVILIPLILIFRRLPFLLGLHKESNFSADHKESLLSKCLEFVLSLEIALIKKGVRFPFGASVFVVLKK